MTHSNRTGRKDFMQRVLITFDCSLCPDAMDPLRSVAEVDYEFPISLARLLEIIHRYDAFACGTGVKIDETILQRTDRLKIIVTPSTGTDHVDKKAIARRGIPLLDIATEYQLLDSFTATAEGTWMLLLACIRQLPRQIERAQAGLIGWGDPRWAPSQLSGKTIGIIGCGRLGTMVASYASAFRMRVLAHDIRALSLPHVQQVDLDTLLSQSDVITLHLHLRDETHRFIHRESFARMKPGVVIVNTARGDLIDESALVENLRSGHVSAAGLDVVHNEWDPDLARHPIFEYARAHDNLIITPHVASACRESIVGARVFIIHKLLDWLRQSDSAASPK